MEKRGEEPATLENFRPHFSANMNADFFFFSITAADASDYSCAGQKKKNAMPKTYTSIFSNSTFVK